MAIINNKDVLQSYILTTAKYDFSVYEKRIIYHLVDLAQSEIEGLQFKNGKDCRKIEHDLFGYVEIEMPVSVILASETDKNHKLAKDALTRLSQKYLIYEDEEIWEKINIVLSPKIHKFKTTVSFKLEPKIWDCMLDFSKGFRKYELKTAMSFESVYSMRFYELLSGQTSPLSYSIEDLKERFQIANKYKNVNDFIRFVIDPAKQELDKKSPYSFTYKTNKTGRKFTSITFFPSYKSEYRDSDLEKRNLQKQVAVSWFLANNEKDYLVHNFDFTSAEIKQHLDLFKQASNSLNLIDFLSKVKPRANRAKNPKGYVIASLKSQLKTT